MKIMILSDIHGKVSSLKRALEIFHQEGFDQIFLLGDLMYHGPRNPLPDSYDPAQVAALLNPLADKITAVRGNCDSEVDQMLLDFPMMEDYSSMTLEGNNFHLTHGHLPEGRVGTPQQGEIRMSGHTHIPVAEQREGVVYFNPGSLSLPKGGFAPSYGRYDQGRLEVVNLEDKGVILAC